MESYFHCYYCDFKTDFDKEYQEHVEKKHNANPCPNTKEINEKGFEKQDKFKNYLKQRR